jgi:hypothetical protein
VRSESRATASAAPTLSSSSEPVSGVSTSSGTVDPAAVLGAGSEEMTPPLPRALVDMVDAVEPPLPLVAAQTSASTSHSPVDLPMLPDDLEPSAITRRTKSLTFDDSQGRPSIRKAKKRRSFMLSRRHSSGSFMVRAARDFA